MPRTDLNADNFIAFRKEYLTTYALVFLWRIDIQTLSLCFKQWNLLLPHGQATAKMNRFPTLTELEDYLKVNFQAGKWNNS